MKRPSPLRTSRDRQQESGASVSQQPASGNRTSQALRGGALSVSAKIANLAIGVAALAMLARLFTPAEYGQFGILMLITTMCCALPAAIGQALIHEGSTEGQVIASYVWIFMATLLMTVAVLVAAEPALISFFGTSLPRSEYPWLFLIVPLATTSAFLDAKLSHAHRFEVLAAGEMVLQILGSVISTIALSFYLNGAHALIAGAAVGYALKLAIQTWSLGGPPPLRSVAPLRPRVSSVGHFAAIHTANYFGVNGDNLVVAKMLGVADLGVYGRAYNLMSKPVMTLSGFITSVYFPLMVSARDDRGAFRSGYLKALAFAAMVGFPLSVYLALVSRDLVAVLLGQRWQAAALPFAFLAGASYFRLAYRVTETVNLARTSLANSVARQGLYATLVIGGAIGSVQWGVVGVAIAVVGALTVFFVVSLLKANQTAECATAQCLKVSAPAALGAVMAAAVMLSTWTALGSGTPLSRLLESASFWLAYGAYWLAASRLYPSDLTVELLHVALSRSRRLIATGT